MNESKDNRPMIKDDAADWCIAALACEIIAAIVLWVLMIALKAAGVIDMHWALVLSSLVWISWALFTITGLLAVVKRLLVRLRRWKVDRRIIRQAKAAGVWGTYALGGRGLELWVWKKYGIQRKPGETDAELRRRMWKQEHATGGGRANE